MISRELHWRLRKNDDDVVWTAKTHPERKWWLYNHNVDLSFTLEAGSQYGIVNKNARLIVRKRDDGKKVANKVLFVREFQSSYLAKNFVDALLFSARLLYGKRSVEAEAWFIEQLSCYESAKAPEPVGPSSYIRSISGYPL